MRPARKGPEKARLAGVGRVGGVASMRPARKGPEKGDPAGFDGAAVPLQGGRPARDRKNPALRRRRVGGRAASMRPARKGPEKLAARSGRRGRAPASMRPARKGPEKVIIDAIRQIATSRLQ